MADTASPPKNIDQWLECVSVHDPSSWENEFGPAGWYAVSVDDRGIIAYFEDEKEAFRFRLNYINRMMNG